MSLPRLLKRVLSSTHPVEVLVVDGGSKDNTVKIAQKMGAKVIKSAPGRGRQLEAGADAASGDVLYFVHADTVPPPSFYEDIHGAVKNGYRAGCFRFKFDRGNTMMRINAYCTRFGGLMFRGGDQSLFITGKLYDEVGGFDAEMHFMEDYDIIRKIKKNGAKFKVLPKNIMVSGRKYEENSYLKVNLVNLYIFVSYLLGVDSKTLKRRYQSLIIHPKFENKKGAR